METDGNTAPRPENWVRPEELVKVREVHLPGVFGDFERIVTERRDRRLRSREPEIQETGRFFDFMLKEVDARAFRRIQDRYLDRSVVDVNSDIVKYIDPLIWCESKLRVSRKIGLNRMPPQRILDLGCGPGHFGIVARFLGHDVTGTDLPARSSGEEHIYDALCAVYKIRRISHMIQPFKPLGDVGGRYDMVTAFLAAFNVYDKKVPWTIDHWRFFLRDVKENVLADNGILFMMLEDRKLTPESWEYLKSLGDWHDDVTKHLHISRFAAVL